MAGALAIAGRGCRKRLTLLPQHCPGHAGCTAGRDRVPQPLQRGVDRARRIALADRSRRWKSTASGCRRSRRWPSSPATTCLGRLRTEAILFTLLIAGRSAFWLVLPISALIVTVPGIIVVSYRQTIRGYPGGGGSYIVARENLGVMAGVIAAGALLTDYVLTVSVSVAAGVAAVTSAFPGLIGGAQVPVAALLIAAVTLVNLRGVRDSATIFAVPTYVFLAAAGAHRRRPGAGCPGRRPARNRPQPDHGRRGADQPAADAHLRRRVQCDHGGGGGLHGVPAFRTPEAQRPDHADGDGVPARRPVPWHQPPRADCLGAAPGRARDDRVAAGSSDVRNRTGLLCAPAVHHGNPRCWRPTPRSRTSRACRHCLRAMGSCPLALQVVAMPCIHTGIIALAILAIAVLAAFGGRVA